MYPLDGSPTSDSCTEAEPASLALGFDFFRERPRNGIRVDFFFARLGCWLPVEGTSRVCVVAWLWVETSLSGCREDEDRLEVRKNSVMSDVLGRMRRGEIPDMLDGQ